MTTQEIHPKHAEALQKRDLRLKQLELKKATVIRAAEAGIRFHHAADGTTFAYKPHGRNVYEVSTALKHPIDTFSKLDGNFVAASNFFAGAKIKLFKPNWVHVTDLFRAVDTMNVR